MPPAVNDRLPGTVRQAAQFLPSNDTEFNLMITNPTWGGEEVPEELREKVDAALVKYQESGQLDGTDLKTLAEIHGFLSRDMRLGNLREKSFGGDEIGYCREHLLIAGMYLGVGFVRGFVLCMNAAAITLELSQSRDGFVRKQMNTITAENVNRDLNPPKKNIFGMAPKN